ncbi:MAG: hypothetical protein JXR05_06415 [Flavobacteriaceae bacterium]
MQKSVDVFFDSQNRRIAFIFPDKEKGSYKIQKQRKVRSMFIVLNKKTIKKFKIEEKDFKQYTYEKHTELGKDIFIIQLDK